MMYTTICQASGKTFSKDFDNLKDAQMHAEDCQAAAAIVGLKFESSFVVPKAAPKESAEPGPIKAAIPVLAVGLVLWWFLK